MGRDQRQEDERAGGQLPKPRSLHERRCNGEGNEPYRQKRDHVPQQERDRYERTGAEIDRQRRRRVAQHDQTQDAGRNRHGAAGQAVGQRRLVDHELHRGRLCRDDSEADPDAEPKRPRQAIDHHGGPERNRELQQHDVPGPIVAGQNLRRRYDRRIADHARQRDWHRIGGKIDVPERAAQDRVGVGFVSERIVLQRRAERRKHAELENDQNGKCNENWRRHCLKPVRNGSAVHVHIFSPSLRLAQV